MPVSGFDSKGRWTELLYIDCQGMSMVQYIIDMENSCSDIEYCMMPVYADKYLPSDLEEMYSKGNLWAGNTLACGYDYGWFGEHTYTPHLAVCSMTTILPNVMPEWLPSAVTQQQ